MLIHTTAREFLFLEQTTRQVGARPSAQNRQPGWNKSCPLHYFLQMLSLLGSREAPSGPTHSQITLFGPLKVTVSCSNGSLQDLGRAKEMPASLHAVRNVGPRGVTWRREASTPQTHGTGSSRNWPPSGYLCQCSSGKARHPPRMTVPQSENGCANNHGLL